MQTYVQWGSIGLAAVASILWIWSACIRVPKLSVPFGGVFKDDHPWVAATSRVTTKNRLTAIFTGAAGCNSSGCDVVRGDVQVRRRGFDFLHEANSASNYSLISRVSA